MERVWVVTGSAGQYSDSYWWIDSVHATHEGAVGRLAKIAEGQAAVKRELGQYHDFVYEGPDEEYDQRRDYWSKRSAEIMVEAGAAGARVDDYEDSHYTLERDYEVQP